MIGRRVAIVVLASVFAADAAAARTSDLDSGTQVLKWPILGANDQAPADSIQPVFSCAISADSHTVAMRISFNNTGKIRCATVCSYLEDGRASLLSCQGELAGGEKDKVWCSLESNKATYAVTDPGLYQCYDVDGSAYPAGDPPLK